MCASSTSGCAFEYFTVQYYIEYSSTVSLFQTQDVIYDEEKKKKSYYPDITGSFFFKRVDRIECSKEPGPVPSPSGVKLQLALSPDADDPSALPSLTSSSQ